MKVKAHSIEDLAAAALQLLQAFPKHSVFAFVGEMGAGKTTFIHRICAVLGVKEKMSSPTFSIVNEYLGGGNTKIYHFDMYRLETEEEALDIGFEEYLSSQNYCFIEWPDKVSSYLPSEAVIVKIELEKETRIISADIL